MNQAIDDIEYKMRPATSDHGWHGNDRYWRVADCCDLGLNHDLFARRISEL